jgi:hypothetical protein
VLQQCQGLEGIVRQYLESQQQARLREALGAARDIEQTLDQMLARELV